MQNEIESRSWGRFSTCPVLHRRQVENLPNESATRHTAVRRTSHRIRCDPSKPRSLLPQAISSPIPPPPRVLTDSRRTTEPTRHSLAADNRPIASLRSLGANAPLAGRHQHAAYVVVKASRVGRMRDASTTNQNVLVRSRT